MAGIRAVLFLSLAFVLGFTLLVVGCAHPSYQNWWPLFVISFYVLSPVPFMLARYFSEDMQQSVNCYDLALFVTTGIVLSSFALPTVLAHAGIIRGGAALFTCLANIVIFVTILAYFYVHRDDDSGTYGSALF